MCHRKHVNMLPAYGWGGMPGPCGPPGIAIRGAIAGCPGPGLYTGLGGPWKYNNYKT